MPAVESRNTNSTTANSIQAAGLAQQQPGRQQQALQSTANDVQPLPSVEGAGQQAVFRLPESPRSALTERSAQGAKVAIPRLKRSVDGGEEDGRGGGRHRVNHACEPCRHRKTKCSGERPVCRHCQDFKISCYYADGKRDRVRKQFGTMSEKVADYEKLLRDIATRVSDKDARLINMSLDKAANTDYEEILTETGTVASVEALVEEEEEPKPEDEDDGAESDASAGAGSTGALDRTEEDFTREGARTTGFMGKNSEITWIQRLKQENRFGDDRSTHDADAGDHNVPLPEAADGFAIHDASYHLDDLPITTFDIVDAYETPPPETANALFVTYMRRMQPSFPIVGQVNLTGQFSRFLAQPDQRPPAKWLAIVNMVFAISAKYSHMVQADWRGDERDHMIYFARARQLVVDSDFVFNHPDLQTIQALGLMSFYLTTIGQVNRAWTIAGIAIRAATALGLNMRNESSNLKDSLKEIRYRLWWALYSLEHRLCSITGRMNCIMDDHCTTPLPVPVDEDQYETEEGKRLLSQALQQGDRAPIANSHSPSVPISTPSEVRSSSSKSEQSRSPSFHQTSGQELAWALKYPPNAALYFLHQVQLTRLTQNIFQQLYNPSALKGNWKYVQLQIADLGNELETWYRRLPAIFDFRRKQRDRDFYEYRMNLGFFYHGTKMMIFRPCLCRLDRKIPNQSTTSHEFNRASAASCVEAAQEMLQLIPDVPNPVGLIRVGPWWSILHWLVQASTVLMLEISFRAHHMPEEAENILESAKKATRWLHAMAEDDLSAQRAWSMFNTLLREAAAKIGRSVDDLPSSVPGAPSYLSSGAMEGPTQIQQQQQYQHPNFSGTAMPSFQTYANYDPTMQYDQYFLNQDFAASMAGGSIPMFAHQQRQPVDVDMEFTTGMYHNADKEQPGSGSTIPDLDGRNYP